MNYLYPLVTLITLVILFHVFLIYVGTQSKKFWKIVDYFWISLGCLGIIGSVNAVRKEFSAARSYSFEQPLIFNYESLAERSKANYKYYADTINGFKYSEFPDQKEAQDFKKAGNFFRSYSDDILKYKDRILVDKNFHYIDTLKLSYNKFMRSTTNAYVKKTAELAGYHLKELERSGIEYDENDNLTHKNSFDWMLLFAAPYLLAIAIAIRLTKVTAELKELN